MHATVTELGWSRQTAFRLLFVLRSVKINRSRHRDELWQTHKGRRKLNKFKRWG